MIHCLFPEHSMIVKSVDYVEKIKTIEALQQENKKFKEALKICVDDMLSEGYTGYEQYRHLLK